MPRQSFLSVPRARALQDTLYVALVLGTAAAFMLFLLGSADILTSLTIIGMLLCLSLVGAVLRFFSTSRVDAELFTRQDSLDQNMAVLQHRVGDHDLTLLKMAGQIETIETDLRAVRKVQTQDRAAHQAFMKGMKDRMLQLVTVLSRPRGTAAKTATGAPKKEKAKNFFPALPAVNVNAPAAPDARPLTGANRYDDDVYVSPSLLRDAIDTAIKTDRVDLYLQPIVTLPQQKIAGFDVYGRVRFQPGVYIPARQYRGAAVHAGAQGPLDRLVLGELAKLVKTLPPAPLFVNITLEGLEQTASLTQIAAVLRAAPVLRDRLVFSLSQKDLGHLSPRAENVVKYLTDLGLKFALNDVQGVDLDMNLLARLKFSYLKLPHKTLVTTRGSDDGAALTQRFITRLQARGITLIAGGLENAGDIRPLLDYPIPMAQGYAFGRPDRPVTYQKKAA